MEKRKTMETSRIDSLLGRKASDSWINMPRYVYELLRDGVITNPEFILYCFLRIQCDPYGRCTVNVKSIVTDRIIGNVSTNYVNKLFNSLLNHKLVYYKYRKGKRGSFTMHFPDFVCPDGVITRFPKSAKTNEDASSGLGASISKSEVGLEVNKSIPMSEQITEALNIVNKDALGTKKTVGNNTDTNTKKKIIIPNRYLLKRNINVLIRLLNSNQVVFKNQKL